MLSLNLNDKSRLIVTQLADKLRVMSKAVLYTQIRKFYLFAS